MLLLSNVPRPNARRRRADAAMGIFPTISIPTSHQRRGAHMRCCATVSAGFPRWAGACSIWGRSATETFLHGLALEIGGAPGDGGFRPQYRPGRSPQPDFGLPRSKAELQECAVAGLPMVCANPDLEVIRGGVRVLCAGALALRYEALGGRVLWLASRTRRCTAGVRASAIVPRERVLAVGDVACGPTSPARGGGFFCLLGAGRFAPRQPRRSRRHFRSRHSRKRGQRGRVLADSDHSPLRLVTPQTMALTCP